MVEKRLDELIIDIVKSVANNNPPPTTCEIRKIYTDNYVDIETDNGTFKYIKCYGNPILNTNAILIFENGENPIVIAPNNADTDLSACVRKDEVGIDLMDNGYLRLKLDSEI